ncbi:L,D-transpeptidase, partial [candidate division WWE3 bacterium]|nr:L,D-transpeptidase [candidate division WWE3 bacterium]
LKASQAGNPVISFETAEFFAHPPDARFSINQNDLKRDLTADKIFSKKPLQIAITQDYKGDELLQNKATDELLDRVTAEALLIKYGRKPVRISSEELRSFMAIQLLDGRKVVKVNEEKISAKLNQLKNEFSLEVKLDDFYAVKAIQHALLFRAGGESLNTAVILPLLGDPKTDGKVGNKYLEINKSQQRMYRFENGKLVKVYIVGTGLTWETPSGDFKILRKNRMSYSYFGNWYLPYMMPIGQMNGYLFGIHQIPYHMDPAGRIYSRDENTMGSPATGGCIQMYEEDVIELYDWVDIGTPVIVTE